MHHADTLQILTNLVSSSLVDDEGQWTERETRECRDSQGSLQENGKDLNLS